MKRSGWKRRRLASARPSSRASSAASPRSPVSITARATAAAGRPNACPIAASTSPSRSPIRSSPPRILTTNVAVSGSQRRRSASKTAAFAAGPRAASMAPKAVATSGTDSAGSGRESTARPPYDAGRQSASSSRAASTSPTARPRSEWRSYAAPSSARETPATRATVSATVAQPRPSARASASAKRSSREEDHGRRQGAPIQGREVVGEESCLLGGPRGGGNPLRDLAPPAHALLPCQVAVAMVYARPDAGPGAGFPTRSRGGPSSCAPTPRATWRPSRAGTPIPRLPASRATRTARCAPTRCGDSSRHASPAPARWPWRSTSGRRTA